MKHKVREYLKKLFKGQFKKIIEIINALTQFINKILGKQHFGRKRMGMIYVVSGWFVKAKTNCPWEQIPEPIGNGKTINGWFNRLSRLDVVEIFYNRLLIVFLENNVINLNRLLCDGMLCFAPRGGKLAKRNPRVRNKCCVNRLTMSNGSGVPLVAIIAEGTAHDSPYLPLLLSKVHSLKMLPKGFYAHADRGFDAASNVVAVSGFGGTAIIATRYRKNDIKYFSNKDKFRWKIERTQSWENSFKAVKTCLERNIQSIKSITYISFAAILSRFTSIRTFKKATRLVMNDF